MFLHRHRSRTLSLVLLSLAWAAFPACAQTSGSLTLVSEYAVRGISLGAGRPAVQLQIDHDAPGGWYLGGFVSPAVLAAPGENRGQAEAIAVWRPRGTAALRPELGRRCQPRQLLARPAEYELHLNSMPAWRWTRPACACSCRPPTTATDRSAYLDLNAFHPLGRAHHADLPCRPAAHLRLQRQRRQRAATCALGVAASLGDVSLQLGLQTLLREAGKGPSRARALTGSAGIRF
jgi:hypothetical protein